MALLLQLPARAKVMPSLAKLENVVNDPKNPVATSKRTFMGRVLRCAAHARKTANNTDPAKLAAKVPPTVPKGNSRATNSVKK